MPASFRERGAHLVRRQGTTGISGQGLRRRHHLLEQPGLDRAITREQSSQAFADHFTFIGVFAAGDLRLHCVGQFARKRDAELLNGTHGRQATPEARDSVRLERPRTAGGGGN